MNFLHVIVAFLSLASPSAAKFQYTYAGVTLDGVQSCIANSNFTLGDITAKRNCRRAFECVMRNIPAYGQTILSSGSAILGFVPTVLLVLGNANEDLVRISTRFPLLALFLSITNINKRPTRHSNMPTTRSSSGIVFLGPYGFVPAAAPGTRTATMRWGHLIIIALAHILAAAGAIGVIWQTVDLGRKAVVTWACWTDYYPLIWLCLAIIHHVKAVIFLRLNLRISDPTPGKNTSRSGLTVWNVLQDSNCRTELVRPRLVRWTKAFADLVNNFNFLYGTAVFSSLTLVSGHNAIKVLAVYGSIAWIARIIAGFVLEMMGVMDWAAAEAVATNTLPDLHTLPVIQPNGTVTGVGRPSVPVQNRAGAPVTPITPVAPVAPIPPMAPLAPVAPIPQMVPVASVAPTASVSAMAPVAHVATVAAR